MITTLLHDPRAIVIAGDALEVVSALADNSVDAVVTDPPAGIAFMGKGWDTDKGGRDAWIAWLEGIMRGALRALKPGGHALVWALPRTSHWTATAIENAGFEIRDVGIHLFGTGFPKSLTSKSADIPEDTGTALKPAAEHWILARKPLDGGVAENYARWGVGILNIGECRINPGARVPGGGNGKANNGGRFGAQEYRGSRDVVQPHERGRWPAHVTLDEDAAAALDEQSGVLTSGANPDGGMRPQGFATGKPSMRGPGVRGADKGGASRFFYVAKGARSEKDAGLDHLPKRSAAEATGREDDQKGLGNPRAGAGRTGGARNFHPTVKSIDLMRWLVRLITPPGGLVLDLFAGSGTTGCAALAEGASCILVEQGGEAGEYLPIIEGRIRWALAEYPAAE